MDKAIGSLQPAGSAAFIKLSSRSPKDACDKLPRAVQLLAAELRTRPHAADRSDQNEELIAMRRAFFLVAAVYSGEVSAPAGVRACANDILAPTGGV